MDPFIAQVVIFAGNFAPRSWAFCDGQLLPISENTALFSLIGTIYGGDGRTTMGLPDLRGRAAIGPRNGPGLSSYREGQRGGAETVTLTQSQMPAHGHNASGKVNTGPDSNLTDVSQGNYLAHEAKKGGDALPIYTSAGANATMADNSVSITVGNAGGSMPHENRMPFLAINYIIALFGTFPSRS